MFLPKPHKYLHFGIEHKEILAQTSKIGTRRGASFVTSLYTLEEGSVIQGPKNVGGQPSNSKKGHFGPKLRQKLENNGALVETPKITIH